VICLYLSFKAVYNNWFVVEVLEELLLDRVRVVLLVDVALEDFYNRLWLLMIVGFY